MTTRRTILVGLGLAPVAAMPAIAAETPEERVERLVAELEQAMAELCGVPMCSKVNHKIGVAAIVAA